MGLMQIDYTGVLEAKFVQGERLRLLPTWCVVLLVKKPQSLNTISRLATGYMRSQLIDVGLAAPKYFDYDRDCSLSCIARRSSFTITKVIDNFLTSR